MDFFLEIMCLHFRALRWRLGRSISIMVAFLMDGLDLG
jgi:hypothetical protein